MTRGIPTARTCFFASIIISLIVSSGCIKPKFTLFPGEDEPLKEFTLQGTGKEKVLVIPIRGFISDSPKDSLLSRKSSMVQQIVSQLDKAEKDSNIKAVILKIDSTGGSVTASDILYHEITSYKENSGIKLVAMIMAAAASGGYYTALPADYIMAHPTSITGSVGVIFLRPNATGIMDKIGLGMEVDKSGKNKDMGSPFRAATEEEQQMFQNLIDNLAERFLSLVESRRKLSNEAKAEISSARIYLAADALRLGLVDEIGYLDDALSKAKGIAGLPEDAKVVVYRRTGYPNDNIYNTFSGAPGMPQLQLIDPGLTSAIPSFHSGFYYLWLPGQSD
jgi:protease-4